MRLAAGLHPDLLGSYSAPQTPWQLLGEMEGEEGKKRVANRQGGEGVIGKGLER